MQTGGKEERGPVLIAVGGGGRTGALTKNCWYVTLIYGSEEPVRLNENKKVTQKYRKQNNTETSKQTKNKAQNEKNVLLYLSTSDVP